MKWFKHYSDNHRGYSIQTLLDKFGHRGVCVYYFMMEMYAEKIQKCDESTEPVVRWNVATLLALLRCNRATFLPIMDCAEELALLCYKVNENFVEVRMPIMMDLLNKDEFRPRQRRVLSASPTPLDKDKDKDKDKDIPSVLKTALDVSLDDEALDTKNKDEEICEQIAAMWNEIALLNALPKVKIPLSRDRKKKMKPAIKEFNEYSDWLRIINGVVDNDFNLGINDRKWKANFDWLFHTTKFNYRKLWESHAEENN